MKTFHLPPSGCLMSLSCGIRTEFGTVYEEYVVGTVILGMLSAVDLALGDKGERRERERGRGITERPKFLIRVIA